MKKKFLALLLTATVLGSIPVAAHTSTSTAMDATNSYTEVITNQKINTVTNEDGTHSEIGMVTIENQPSSFEAKANGCTSGHHLNVVNNGTPETTRLHGATHPGYCTVRTTTYWRCTNCNTTGHDDTYQLVWCPSASISGDPVSPEAPGAQ